MAIVLTVVAMAMPIQRLETSCPQTSTYALVRALSTGTGRIDRYESETCDKSYRQGHFYSNKAPGLALVILPAYALLHSTSLMPGNGRLSFWLLSLWSSVLPAAVMVLLARRVSARFDPETGTLVAVALGLATLALPLATVDFGHVLAATLLLASFAISLSERHATGRLALLMAAGILAGYAVATEYPSALIAGVIGIYAATANQPVRRLLAFGVGGLVGVAPLLVYNQLVFGSVTSLSYAAGVTGEAADGGVQVTNSAGFYGVLTPSISALARALMGDRGLIVVTPVMVLVGVGVVLLGRAGWHAEATAIGAIVGLMLLYTASLTISPGWVFGGDSPGVRYAFLCVPFAVLPLGLVYRTAPAVVIALLSISFVRMVTATATQPLIGSEGTRQWLRRARDGDFTDTLFTRLGLGHGWVAITPFLLVAVLAALAAVLTAPPDRERWLTSEAVTALGAWVLVAIAGGAFVRSTAMLPAMMALAVLATGCLTVIAAHLCRSASAGSTTR